MQTSKLHRRALTLFALLGLVASLAPAAVAQTPGNVPSSSIQRGPIRELLDEMTLEEKVGQMFMVHGFGTSLNDPDPAMIQANQDLYGVDDFEGLIDKYHVGGIIYFGFSNNVDSPQQVASLSNEIQTKATGSGAGVPMLIAADQEQGLVSRLLEPFTQFPGNMAVAATRKTQLARSAARITGNELLAIGINENFAPVADVNMDPANPVIGIRSFGSRAGLVSRFVEAQVKGFHDAGISSTAKHFPGHGDTGTDSHTDLPVIDHNLAELNKIDLPPFQAAIDAGVDAIMTAHILVEALDDSGVPATLSRPILTDLLRKEMGFDGVIVTDALTMEGVRQMFPDDRIPVEAIKAGADLMLMPPEMDESIQGVLDAVAIGEISEQRIDRSVRRILRLKAKRGLLDGEVLVDVTRVSEVVGTPEHQVVADKVGRGSVTLLRNTDGILPLDANTGQSALLAGWGPTTLNTLDALFRLRGVTPEVLDTGTTPNAAAIDTAVAAAEGKSFVFVSTNSAWRRPGQQDLIAALRETGIPVIVVSMNEPYDVAHLDDAPTYLSTYGFRWPSLTALTRVLFGEGDARGRLPVEIPTADGLSTLFPYGYRGSLFTP
ncbi:MAG: glycoside hydrolase family 3 protein [Actinobacteria bacterium]|nr:glycoside hydrolase family 3 protein [Actinomycetota bacterium]